MPNSSRSGTAGGFLYESILACFRGQYPPTLPALRLLQ